MRSLTVCILSIALLLCKLEGAASTSASSGKSHHALLSLSSEANKKSELKIKPKTYVAGSSGFPDFNGGKIN